MKLISSCDAPAAFMAAPQGRALLCRRVDPATAAFKLAAAAKTTFP